MDLRDPALSPLSRKGYVIRALDLLIEPPGSQAAWHPVVARASTDQHPHKSLLEGPRLAHRSATSPGEHMVALENTARAANMVVCALLLLPRRCSDCRPSQYKSANTSRVRHDPRGVSQISAWTCRRCQLQVQIRQPDRYLVLPRQPGNRAGPKSSWSLITQDSMIAGRAWRGQGAGRS
jgi:hypothetical protein